MLSYLSNEPLFTQLDIKLCNSCRSHLFRQQYCQVAAAMAVAKDILSMDDESANEQQTKIIGTNYQPYWMKQ